MRKLIATLVLAGTLVGSGMAASPAEAQPPMIRTRATISTSFGARTHDFCYPLRSGRPVVVLFGQSRLFTGCPGTRPSFPSS